jgi:hypothetical protein
MPMKNWAFLRNPFSFLFARSSLEDRLAAYVIREHGRGRPLREILDDPYVRNRASERQIARLLERPDVVHAVGQQAVEQARLSLA